MPPSPNQRKAGSGDMPWQPSPSSATNAAPPLGPPPLPTTQAPVATLPHSPSSAASSEPTPPLPPPISSPTPPCSVAATAAWPSRYTPRCAVVAWPPPTPSSHAPSSPSTLTVRTGTAPPGCLTKCRTRTPCPTPP
ncbi:hypothetical protein PVAP13_5NG013900 [Panicum virgatum]|uniref:Uncharacterized protein n=1 Tax=Panicum virgatum TaxID=38727 RepID=A0A8T0RK83_PANVG|nr:hypothetical protein PVAP13_5NG013900 [Panicum virgatum]